MIKNELNYFASLLEENVGWQIADSDLYLLSAKIDNVMRKNNISDIKTLIDEMEKSPKVFAWQVIESIASLNTSFYRDYNVFSSLENILFPYLLENNRATKRIKILSLGCSTGQELYSIAMSVKKKIPDYKNWDIKLLGLDISSDAVIRAQKGSYNSFEIQHGLNAKDIIENFKNTGNFWQANQDLMDMVKFKRGNIIYDSNSSEKYDVIFCRNVINIFSPELQRKIVQNIYNHQGDGSFVILGLGERINGFEDYYEPSDIKCVYKSKYMPEKMERLLSSVEAEMPSFQRPKTLKI